MGFMPNREPSIWSSLPTEIAAAKRTLRVTKMKWVRKIKARTIFREQINLLAHPMYGISPQRTDGISARPIPRT